MHECSQGGNTLILTSADNRLPLPAVSAYEGHAQALQGSCPRKAHLERVLHYSLVGQFHTPCLSCEQSMNSPARDCQEPGADSLFGIQWRSSSLTAERENCPEQVQRNIQSHWRTCEIRRNASKLSSVE